MAIPFQMNFNNFSLILHPGGFIKVGVWHTDENGSSLQLSQEAMKKSRRQSQEYERPLLIVDTLMVSKSS